MTINPNVTSGSRTNSCKPQGASYRLQEERRRVLAVIIDSVAVDNDIYGIFSEILDEYKGQKYQISNCKRLLPYSSSTRFLAGWLDLALVPRP
jgi:hypothetical protein